MRRTAMIAVVISVVAGCAGSPPAATQPPPVASPADAVKPTPAAASPADTATSTPAAVAASTPPGTGSPSPATASPAQTPSTTPGFSLAPALGATTGWIAYQEGSTADLRRERIRVVRPDGTDDHELFGEISYTKHMHPAWSPDGQQIAFGVEEGGPDRVYVANADGSDVRLLTDCRDEDCVGFGHPVWSPDGSTIAVRYDGGAQADGVPTQLGLALVDVASGDYEIISQGTEYQDIYPRWSPDGRQLVFWREQFDADEVAVFTMNIDGTDVRQLTPWEMRAGDPDWSPDGSWIVFGTHPLRGHDGGHWVSNLYLIRPDGTDMRQLTHFGDGDARAVHPRWTPDGDGIVYARIGATGSREIWAISSSGTNDAIAVPPHSGRLMTHPAVQPRDATRPDEGGWVIYQAVYPDGVDIGRMRLDGTEAERLPVTDYERWHPRWSPDGTLIVYDRWYPRAETQHIAVVAPDGSEDRLVVECVSPCLGIGYPAWSPDGQAIVFEGISGQDWDSPDRTCHLGLYDVDSGDVTYLLSETGCGFSYMTPHFAPDGTRIVFKRIDEAAGRAALFTVAVDGSDLQQLTDWGLGARPEWSPDGDWIVFTDVEHASPFGQVDLYRIRPDGTDLVQLTDMPGPTTGDVYPRWLPDGSAILFSRCDGGFACETRLISPDGSDDRPLVPAFGSQVIQVMVQPTSLSNP